MFHLTVIFQAKNSLQVLSKDFLKIPILAIHYYLLREIYNTRLKKQIWIIMETIYISTRIYYDIYMSSNIKGEAH